MNNPTAAPTLEKDLERAIQEGYVSGSDNSTHDSDGFYETHEPQHVPDTHSSDTGRSKGSKGTGKGVNDAYTHEELFKYVQSFCLDQGVEITEQLPGGGCSVVYSGKMYAEMSPETAFIETLRAVDKSLADEPALKYLKVALKRKTHGVYMIDHVDVESQAMPDSYFTDRDDLPESYTLYGTGRMLPVQGEDFEAAGQEPDVLARIYQAIKKIENAGEVHLNTYGKTVDVVVKAVTKSDQNMLNHERNMHALLAWTGVVPRLYAAGTISLPNKDPIETDPDAQDHEMPILVMEMIEGKTLDKYVEQEKLPEIETLQLFGDVAAAVGVVHSAGITHRDIKPKNIMITDEGLVKVLDFGLSAISNETPPDLGRVNMTPYYCTPEHIEQKVDPRMDVYSLGASFCEILLGQTPLHEQALKLEKILQGGDSEQIRGALEEARNTPHQMAANLLISIYQSMKKETFFSQTETGEVRLNTDIKDPEQKKYLEEKLKGMSKRTEAFLTTSLRGDPNRRYQSCDEMSRAAYQLVGQLKKELDDALTELTLKTLRLDSVFGDDAVYERRAKNGTAQEEDPDATPEHMDAIAAAFLRNPDPAPNRGIGKGLFGRPPRTAALIAAEQEAKERKKRGHQMFDNVLYLDKHRKPE